MKRVCRGAFSLGSRFNEAIERARGSSKDATDDSIVLPLGGVSDWGVDVLIAWT